MLQRGLKTSKNKFVIVGNIYRPPNTDIRTFNSKLDNILESIKSDPILNKSSSVELIGDINIDVIKYKLHGDTTEYLETLLSHGQLPLVTHPTRICHSTATLLDHITTSYKSDRYDCGIIMSAISDHSPVFYIRQSQMKPHHLM